jgi:hypothetical protein
MLQNVKKAFKQFVVECCFILFPLMYSVASSAVKPLILNAIYQRTSSGSELHISFVTTSWFLD